MGALFSAQASVAESAQIQQQRTLANISTGCALLTNQSIDHLKITFDNTDLPNGFTLSQNALVAPSCILTNGATALAKALQSSTVSAAAKRNAGLSIGLVDVDVAKTASFSEMVQTIEQSIKSKCDVSDIQTMHDVTLIFNNSRIGAVNIDQNTNMKANCTIDSIIKANADVQQTVTTSADAGGGKGDWKSLLIIGAVIIAALVILGIGFAVYSNMQKKKTATATAKGGLPSGTEGEPSPSGGMSGMTGGMGGMGNMIPGGMSKMFSNPQMMRSFAAVE